MAQLQASPSRPHFEPDGASPEAAAVRNLAAPALSSDGALARFEFEAGHGNDGTKILMVEWDKTGSNGRWEVSWDGKTTRVSEREGVEGGRKHRVYFLLQEHDSIPPIVKISQEGGKSLQTNSLPAIYNKELGASARTAGKKGVLHTIWAKKRLSVLQQEIDKEMEHNAEGVALEMAIQEKQWIEERYGIGLKQEVHEPLTPNSPRSAGGGRSW